MGVHKRKTSVCGMNSHALLNKRDTFLEMCHRTNIECIYINLERLAFYMPRLCSKLHMNRADFIINVQATAVLMNIHST